MCFSPLFSFYTILVQLLFISRSCCSAVLCYFTGELLFFLPVTSPRSLSRCRLSCVAVSAVSFTPISAKVSKGVAEVVAILALLYTSCRLNYGMGKYGKEQPSSPSGAGGRVFGKSGKKRKGEARKDRTVKIARKKDTAFEGNKKSKRRALRSVVVPAELKDGKKRTSKKLLVACMLTDFKIKEAEEAEEREAIADAAMN